MTVPPDLRFLTDGSHEQAVYVTHRAARAARTALLPESLDGAVRAALAATGIDELYIHQREAFDLLAAGTNVVVSTGTASGKSLCFTLPVLDTLTRDPQARALFLYPTKALAQDQARKIGALRLRGVAAALYDGDTPQAQRAAVRKRGGIVLSNPDMLHVGILPGHEQWAEFLHHLRYVVLDEAHVYRGVFGSHVAQVVRRLRRLCAQYGSTPRFVLSSATIANPLPFAETLIGLPFAAVTESGAPVAEQTIVLWNPPLEDPGTGRRKSTLAEVSYLVSESVLRGARVIAFAPTRRATELVYTHVKRRLDERGKAGAAERVLPYRAGYTPQQRRDIERRLFEHELDAVVTTDALELGIDVGSLDAALVTGFPGTIMSLRQRWGRAGRAGHGWAVLVAGQDALDQYFMREPERLLSREVEEAVVDLTNPHILAAQLGAAAYERPLTEADDEFFGAGGMARAAQLAASGQLRRRHGSLAWSRPHSPAPQVSLRSASTEEFVIVETREGSILGSVDRDRVFRATHPGAIYLHLGRSYLVRRLDLAQRTVLVDDFNGSYYTQPKSDKEIAIVGGSPVRPLANGAQLFFGTIDVTEQVIAYRKVETADGRILDTVSLDLPEQSFETEALWFTLPDELLEQHLDDGDEMGALHAAEHAAIAVLPLYAMCDRWDIGGLSTNFHHQTGMATIFVYDGYPGGIGLARRACEAFEPLATDARTLVAECPCDAGCPSCVQSPKCGNLNEPLSKQGAVALLQAVLTSA